MNDKILELTNRLLKKVDEWLQSVEKLEPKERINPADLQHIACTLRHLATSQEDRMTKVLEKILAERDLLKEEIFSLKRELEISQCLIGVKTMLKRDDIPWTLEAA